MPHFMIINSPYYSDVSDNLLAGARAVFDARHITYEVFDVPGALEIPLAIKFGVSRKDTRGVGDLKFDGAVALGCIIRGETSHYDIVCNESARGLSMLSLDHDLPIGNAILTCENMDQAIVRSDPKQKDKGGFAANAAAVMFEMKKELSNV